ncbi:MAG: hypothetical protein ILO43_03415 [Clostridia bacterium]|nr:hypothetical protein [Clostridia bacterium]
MKHNSKLSRVFVILMALSMVFMLTACSEATSNFLKYGWDYEANGIQYEPGFEYTYEYAAPAPGGYSAGASAYSGSSAYASSDYDTAGDYDTDTYAYGDLDPNAKVSDILGGKTGKPAGAAAPAAAANKTSYTAAEALELYKSAANKVKSNAKSATRTSETIKTISGSIPSLYSTFGFKEGTNTEKVVASGSSQLREKFPVEGKNYTCNLSASDIKSASVQVSGSNRIVTIVVKDDNPGTYSNSSKCVSTISIPIGTWTCKGVTLRGTIDGNGRLTSLYYKMPTYVTQGSDAFAFSLEQNWSVAY